MHHRSRTKIVLRVLLAVSTLGLGVANGSSPADAATTATVTQSNAPAPIYGSVQMHGSGFVANQPVAFKPCNVLDPVSGLICADSPPYGAGTVADATGSFDFVWPAPSGNCSTSACQWNFYQPTTGVVLFNPVVYDPMDHSIAISQRIPYSGGAVVAVNGAHWPSLQSVSVLQCSSGGCVSPALVAGGTVTTTTIFGGTFSVDAKLRRSVRGVDCYAHRCWLSARMGVTTLRTAELDLVMSRSGWTAAVGYYNDAAEGDEFGCAPVILTKLSSENVIVAYHSFAIDATPGVDYTTTAGSLIIQAGQYLGCARVNLIDDSDDEGVEMIGVHLDAIAGSAVLVDGGRDSYIFVRDDD